MREVGRQLHNLVRLDISQSTWQWGNNIDGLGHEPEAFEVLAKGCTKLRSLSLSYLPLLVPLSMKAITTHCTLLKHLDLSNCSMELAGVEPVISDELIDMIAQNVRGLQSLLLCEATEISDKSCESLGLYAQNLVTLSLAQCEQLTDEAIQHLGRCPNLYRVDISGLTALTAQSLPAFRQLMRNGLKHIVVFDKHESRKGSIVSLEAEETEEDGYEIKQLLQQDPLLCKILARMSMALTMSFDAYERDYCPNSFLKAWPNPGKAEWL